MQNQDKRFRNTSIDAVGGMMILYMIFGHIWTNCGMIDNNFRTSLGLFLNCFMPWFFFKGGMFFRPMQINDLLKKDFCRLLIPFCVFSFFGIVINTLCGKYEGGANFVNLMLHVAKYGSFAENAPLWFLVSLAISRFCFNCVLKIRINYCQSIYFLIILSIYLLVSYSSITLPWYFANSMAGSLFLISGYYLKDLQYNKGYFALSVVLVAFFLTKYECRVGMFNNELMLGDYIGWLFSSVAAIIVLNNLFKFIARITWLEWINMVGRHSMSYYCIHWPLITIVLSILSIFSDTYPPIIKFVVCCSVSILFLPIVDSFLHYKKMKILIGEKA